MEHSSHNFEDVDSSFLYLSVAEFRALQELAQETLRGPVSSLWAPTTNVNSHSTPNPNPNPFLPEDPLSNPVDRVYPHITAPIHRELSS